MAQQSSFYNTDGTTRTYPSSKHIASKQHVAVYFQSATTSAWSIVESSQYEVVNNSIVFYTAPVETIYSQIEIRVADTTAELEDSPSDIAIVAGAISSVINVANNLSVIDNVNDNMGAITTVSANTTNLNSIVDDVIPNLPEILLADDNAAIATASATLAQGYAESIVPSSLVKNIDTIADLATISPTTIGVDNVFVKDLDRGGLFVWSSTGTANGGTVFAGLTGYWVRQYSGAVNVKWFGAKGDGITDDTLTVQTALYCGDTSLEGISDVLISSITVPSNTKLITHGCKIKSDGSANIIVTMLEGSYCDNLIVYSDTQKANTANLLYGAVKINGNDVTVDFINVAMFDYGITIYSANNFKCNSVYVSSYVRGVYIRNSDSTNINLIKAETASENSTSTAGHNGLLISSGLHHVIGKVEVSNSGEHAVRIGGAYSGENVVEYLTIGTIIAKQIGQCGLKINPNFSQRVNYVNIGDVFVTDCAYNNSTGENEDGVRIQKASNVNIDSISVFKDTKANSCYDGVFIDDTINLHIGTVNVHSPLRDGIHIQDVSADDAGVFADVNNIFIDNISIYTPINSGVYVTSTTQQLRYIVMPNIYVATPSNRGVEVYATTVTQNCLFNGFVNTPTNEAFVGSSLPNMQVNIQCNTLGKSYGVKTSAKGVSTIEQKASFSNANITNADSIFIQNWGTEAQGAFGGAISFSGTGQSDRRRAAIVAKQTGASAPQVGLEFWVHNSTTSATNALDRALTLQHDGTLALNVDNLSSLGTASFRWSTVYAGTGTINTSDITTKTFYEISEAERLCAIELKGMMRKFKFNDAIDSKGEENARIHFGVGAQWVRDVFSKYDLNPFDYALLCYDSWEEIAEVLDEDGNVIQPYIPAGDRYGIRYEELLCFIISAI